MKILDSEKSQAGKKMESISKTESVPGKDLLVIIVYFEQVSIYNNISSWRVHKVPRVPRVPRVPKVPDAPIA